jgi:hypothetical protein
MGREFPASSSGDMKCPALCFELIKTRRKLPLQPSCGKRTGVPFVCQGNFAMRSRQSMKGMAASSDGGHKMSSP